MMTRMISPLLALCLAFCLAGCGDDGTSNTTGTTPEPTPKAADLVGKWKSACVDPGNGQGFTLSFDLTASNWKLDYDSFADATCATKNLTVHIEGAYRLGDASQSVMGAREGEFDFDVKTVTPASDGAAMFLGTACGGGTFTAGQATDILGGCAGIGAYPVADCPTDYDIIKRDGDTLTFGLRPMDNNMCSPDKRPTALGVPLSRQP